MSERDIAKAKAHKSVSPQEWARYRELRNQVTKLNRRKKKEYYQLKLKEANKDSKKVRKVLNNIMGRDLAPVVSHIYTGGTFISKAKDIANYFVNYYSNKITNLKSNMSRGDSTLSHHLIQDVIMNNKQCQLKFEAVNAEMVERLLISLPDDTSSGSDNIDSKLLKVAAKFVSPPICHIFNRSLACSLFPLQWKESKIIPIPKNKNDVFNGVNSRPISLLPVLSKSMERIVYEQIQYYLTENQLLTQFQHAYKPGYSTSSALIHMTDNWYRYLDNGNLVRVVFLEFSAAFDLINHDLLIDKLKCYGFSPAALCWMESYLSGRRQKVYYNGYFSEGCEMNCGLPQGSCLGPLLYSVFTNDLPYVLDKSHLVMYADDSTMFYSASNYSELTSVLQQDLLNVFDWISKNNMILNVSKSKSMSIGSRVRLVNCPQLNLSIAGPVLEQVTQIKLLGVTINHHLSWSQHINSVIKKMGQGIAIARKCSFYITSSIMKDVINALVLSHLEYCSSIWSAANKTDLNRLQLVQNRAARLVLRCSYYTNIDKMHDKLSWLSVQAKLYYGLLIFKESNTGKHTTLFLCSVAVSR
uniref:Reverse transcriptase domain-containing protein n=1 Tax=Oreochromis niloticus TaxID=8128 RepID=A0A669AV95_ORENI